LEVPVTERPLTLRVDPRFDFARRLAPGELPPTIRDLMQTEGATAVLAGSDAFAEGAQAIADRLFGAETTLIAAAAMPDDAAAVLVLGETEAVSALRDASLPHPPRAVAHEGVSRTWAERAPDGTLWVFASADDAESFAQRLRQLPYYGGSSFVVLDADGESHVGTWPVTENPLHRKLDVATE
jgi:hypothetical protein